MNELESGRLLAGMVTAAAEAGAIAHAFAATPFEARRKADDSPVTDADVAAEAAIREHLTRLLPGVPVIGEESVSAGERLAPGGRFFLVDPIDGTREYVARRKDDTVNIALVAQGAPRLGVIYAPAYGRLYAGSPDGAWRIELPPGAKPEGLPRTAIRTRPRPARMVAVASHSHLDPQTEAWLRDRPIERTVQVGSSIKFARLAEGEADVYPRFGPVSEWDIAAGHAILVAAGGSVAAPGGDALRYGGMAEGYRVREFIARATRDPV
jgi:3'(2'), 5'-bisphosphate nucleotidase